MLLLLLYAAVAITACVGLLFSPNDPSLNLCISYPYASTSPSSLNVCVCGANILNYEKGNESTVSIRKFNVEMHGYTTCDGFIKISETTICIYIFFFFKR